ncbi:hypothetical protein LCGC14_2354250 [marine sediment metagenome]|uniref:Uncharacterized protein n=1 Tax=marine sediment metagenome TaxID=412755 RepID=A0A0F9EKZ9_9ZZZZ
MSEREIQLIGIEVRAKMAEIKSLHDKLETAILSKDALIARSAVFSVAMEWPVSVGQLVRVKKGLHYYDNRVPKEDEVGRVWHTTSSVTGNKPLAYVVYDNIFLDDESVCHSNLPEPLHANDLELVEE